MSPMMIGLLVTISHLPVAPLPTTQNNPSARGAVPDANNNAQATITRFIAQLRLQLSSN
jgi:hypothetical protein